MSASDDLPEFLANTPDEVTPAPSPGAARQRAYRQRLTAQRNAERNAEPESVTPEAESKSNVTSPGVTPLRNTRRNAGDAKGDAKGDNKQASRRKVRVRMTDTQYAETFQALHMIAAGVTGVPELAVTEMEAAPVGKALQVCADYYGWDFLEKLGPVFTLGLTVGTLEMRVMSRTKRAIPRVAQEKAAARRRKQERQTTAQPTATEAPATPTASMNPAAMLAALEEQTSAIPENIAELLADV